MLSEIKDYVEYRDGKLYWIKKHCNKVVVGNVAGSLCGGSYLAFKLKRKRYMVHHAVWYLHGNTIPDGYMLDHINRDRLDNRIENLRLATPSENSANSSRYGNRNCYWNDRVQAYQVRVQFQGKCHHVGRYFKTLEAAKLAAKGLREKVHAEYSVTIT